MIILINRLSDMFNLVLIFTIILLVNSNIFDNLFMVNVFDMK